MVNRRKAKKHYLVTKNKLPFWEVHFSSKHFKIKTSRYEASTTD